MSTTPMKTHHSIGWSPETWVGRWAVSLAGLALGGIVAVSVAFAVGLPHGGGFTDNWIASLMGVTVAASAVGSAVTGLLAVFRRHDHAWLVFAATSVGVLLTALMLREIAQGLGWLSS